MIRLIKWGYYLFLAWRYTRRAEKWSDLYDRNGELVALDVSDTYLELSSHYIHRAEELYT